MEEGGCEKPELWFEIGGNWLRVSGVEAPKYWFRRDGAWWTRIMDRSGPVDPRKAVCHVYYHEAEACARFVGKRRPPKSGVGNRGVVGLGPGSEGKHPGGDAPATSRVAYVDALAFDTAPLWAYPEHV